jgi:antitoxin component YwqK of YwqJK toxin-antitoxin module
VLRVDENELDWDEDNEPSYRGEPFTGESAEYAPDGRLMSLTTYVDGLADGPFQVWAKTGTLIVEGRSRLGDPVGTQREWYDNGAPKAEHIYGDGGRLLNVRNWDENGNLTLDETYR